MRTIVPLAALVACLLGTLSVLAQAPHDPWAVSFRAAGPVVVDTPIDQIRRAIGDPSAPLVQALHQNYELPRLPDGAACGYLFSAKVPDGVGLMFQDGLLTRVDVSKPGIRTTLGAQVGDSEARIRQLYGRSLLVQPDHYPPAGAHDFVVSPETAVDRGYELLFETDGQRVRRFRIGTAAAVSQTEGCA